MGAVILGSGIALAGEEYSKRELQERIKQISPKVKKHMRLGMGLLGVASFAFLTATSGCDLYERGCLLGEYVSRFSLNLGAITGFGVSSFLYASETEDKKLYGKGLF